MGVSSMSHKSQKKRIKGLLRLIQMHEDKVRAELRKEQPSFGDIHHWNAEINAFQTTLERVKRRLGR